MYKERIRELLDKMTFEEKVGQLSQIGTSIYSKDLELNEEIANLIRSGRVGSFLSVCGVETLNTMQRIAVEESRLGIPLFFGNDVIHGYRVIFPNPTGEACSFEPELSRENYKAIARESRANGTHITWYPMVDISYDQRWGRGFEGAGEDVYLGCEFAKARVHGLKNGDLKDNTVLGTCAKHFAAYGAVQGGRDYNSVDISDNALYNTYLPPFRAAVNAGVDFVMTAFNDINGIPCTANKRLIKDILRDEMGFDGIVISDACSLVELIAHGFAKDEEEAAQKALEAGVDIEMSSVTYREALKNTPENIKLIDEAVYRILDLKFRLGLFENPYADTSFAKENTARPEYFEMARNTAKRSMVLLENNGVLPFTNKKVSVIGKLADDRVSTVGGWVCTEMKKACDMAVTILDGVKNCNDIDFTGYAPAYEYIDTQQELLENLRNGQYEHLSTNKELINDALETAAKSDVILFVTGEPTFINGEARSRASLTIPKPQLKVLDELKKLNKPIVMLVVTGRPLLVGEVKDKVDALIFTYSLGTEAGNAVTDVITGKYNPSGKLVITIPSADGQCPTMHYAHLNSGKPFDETNLYRSRYVDVSPYPAYCFGYGKSYTEFKCSDFKLDKDEYKFGDTVRAEITIENTGEFDGEEVVQIYMRDLVGSIVRPIKQLIGFKKCMIKKGESKVISIDIDTNKMGYYIGPEYIKEPGEFIIFAGNSSDTAFEKKIVIN